MIFFIKYRSGRANWFQIFESDLQNQNHGVIMSHDVKDGLSPAVHIIFIQQISQQYKDQKWISQETNPPQFQPRSNLPLSSGNIDLHVTFDLHKKFITTFQ